MIDQSLSPLCDVYARDAIHSKRERAPLEMCNNSKQRGGTVEYLSYQLGLHRRIRHGSVRELLFDSMRPRGLKMTLTMDDARVAATRDVRTKV